MVPLLMWATVFGPGHMSHLEYGLRIRTRVEVKEPTFEEWAHINRRDDVLPQRADASPRQDPSQAKP